MKRINHRNARRITWSLLGLGLFVGRAFVIFSEAALVIGILIILAGVGVVLLYWRCPHCDTMLPSREGRIKYCPHCGEPL